MMMTAQWRLLLHCCELFVGQEANRAAQCHVEGVARWSQAGLSGSCKYPLVQ